MRSANEEIHDFERYLLGCRQGLFSGTCAVSGIKRAEVILLGMYT